MRLFRGIYLKIISTQLAINMHIFMLSLRLHYIQVKQNQNIDSAVSQL